MSESGYRVVIISHSVLAASSLHRQQVCRSNFYWGGKEINSLGRMKISFVKRIFFIFIKQTGIQ